MIIDKKTGKEISPGDMLIRKDYKGFRHSEGTQTDARRQVGISVHADGCVAVGRGDGVINRS